jgi:hypothetical protein
LFRIAGACRGRYKILHALPSRSSLPAAAWSSQDAARASLRATRGVLQFRYARITESVSQLSR